MHCRQCGVQLQENSVFCQNCGAKVMNAPKPDQTPESSNCPVCQTPLKPGALFCGNCGSSTLPSRQPVAQQPPSPPAYQPPQPVYQQQSWQPPLPVQNWQQPPQQPWQQPPHGKPKRKKWVVPLVIILVVALAAVGVFAFAGDSVRRLILGPKKAYLAVEASSMKSDASDWIEDLARIGNIESDEIKGGAIVGLSLDMPGMADTMDPMLVDVLDALSVRLTSLYNRDEDDPMSYAAIDLQTGDERLLTLELYMEDDQMVIGLQDIFDSWILIDDASLQSTLSMVELDLPDEVSPIALLSGLTSTDLGIDEKKMEQSVYALIDIILEHIDEASYESRQTIEAGAVSGTYGAYTITITSESLQKMLLALMEQIRDDETIYDLYVNLYDQFYGSLQVDGYFEGATDRETWDNFFDEAIEEIGSEIEPEDAFTLIQTVYVDGKGEIRGRLLNILDEDDETEATLTYYHPVDQKQEGLLIEFEDSTESFSFLAEYDVDNEFKTGVASLSVQGEPVMKASFTDLDDVVIDDQDYLLGDLSIEILDDTAELPGNIIYRGSEEDGVFTADIGVEGYMTATIEYEKLSAADAEITLYNTSNLVRIDDQEALMGLLTEDAMNELLDILSRLGLDMN